MILHLKKIQFHNLILFVILLLLFLKGIFFLDPDFGWHLKMGELITKYGIPKTDPFSYTMPSYPFVDHEWLTNIIIYQIYSQTKMFGLAIVYSLVAVFSLLILMPKKGTKFSFSLFLLSVAILTPIAGVRPQLESWFFFAVLLRVILNSTNWLKWRFFLPVLFILWVNLHGSFAIGIAVLAIAVLTKSWQEKRLSVENLTVLVFSLLATLINPYQLDIWREVINQMSDSSLRWTIGEWYPLILQFNPPFIFLSVISGFLIIWFRKSFDILTKFLWLMLLLLGLSSQRHIPFWVLINLPVTITSFNLFYQQATKIKGGAIRFKQVYKWYGVAVLGIILLQIWMNYGNGIDIREESFYPKGAVTFLKSKQIQGEIFANYGWGGYLIWKLPQKKVFIDGRMPSWRWQAPGNESNYAFEDYQKFFTKEDDFNNITIKYNIKYILWNSPPKKTALNPTQSTINNWFNYLFPSQKTKLLSEKLISRGWKIIYQDSVSIIYSKDN